MTNTALDILNGLIFFFSLISYLIKKMLNSIPMKVK